MLTDCSQFALGSRQRQVCEGASDWTLKRVNVFREMHGIEPLEEIDEEQPQQFAGSATVVFQRTNPSAAKTKGSCCGGSKPKPGVVAQRMVEGTGTGGRLIEIFKAHGFETCDACYDLARRMNEWGREGCRDNLELIIADILPRALEWEKMAFGWWSNLLPTAVTEAAIREIVERAIDTSKPLEWHDVSSQPQITLEAKRPQFPNVNNFSQQGAISMLPSSDNPPLIGKPIDRNKLQAHIMYHVMPLQGETEWVWRKHCDWLREVRPQFNGRLIIGIVTPGVDDHWRYFHPGAVHEALKGLDAEFISAPNDVVRKSDRQGKGEGVLFPMLLEKLLTNDPDQVAFYGHCKGVSRKLAKKDDPPHLWADVMFETLFRNRDAAIKSLDSHGICGPFMMRGRFSRGLAGVGPDWFYSGTFFAMRLADVFKRKWRRLPSGYGCVEQWPRLNFRIDTEADCLFMNGVQNLYDDGYWDRQVAPALQEWRAGQLRLSGKATSTTIGLPMAGNDHETKECENGKDNSKPPSLATQLAGGAIGLAKNITGTDQAPPEVIAERYEICKACYQYKRWQCQKCGCPVAAKVRIASESCPDSKWPSVKAKD